jgi:hypothetical protein
MAAEKSLDVIKNQDYVTLKVAAQIWPASIVKSDALQELADLGLMQSQDLMEWKEAGEHQVPSLQPGEIVLFVPFVRANLCLPASPFLYRFL